MNKYTNGKIYKIVSPNTEKIYIGSTTQKLNRRLSKHEGSSSLYCSSKEIIILGGSKIELIEDYPCNNKKELLEREQFYIDLYKTICVNKNNTIMDENSKKQYHKTYYEKNKEDIQAYKKTYRENNRENIQAYKENNKEAIRAYEKDYREKNKEAMQAYKKAYNEKHSDRINCGCGGKYTLMGKSRHEKTKKHLKFILI